jgi:hypothetical protein
MTEDHSRALEALWKRFWPWIAVLLLTFGSGSFLGYVGARVMYSYYPTVHNYLWVLVSAVCWIIAFVGCGWVLYRRKMGESEDQSPLFAALGSAIVVFTGAFIELGLTYLVLSSHRH